MQQRLLCSTHIVSFAAMSASLGKYSCCDASPSDAARPRCDCDYSAPLNDPPAPPAARAVPLPSPTAAARAGTLRNNQIARRCRFSRRLHRHNAHDMARAKPLRRRYPGHLLRHLDKQIERRAFVDRKIGREKHSALRKIFRMRMLLRRVELAHPHAQIGAKVVAQRQTAVTVEFFHKMFHSEPPGRAERGSERKAPPKGEVRRITLF